MKLAHDTWFDTVTVVGVDADRLVEAAAAAGYDIRRVDDQSVSMSFDETTTERSVDAVVAALLEANGGVESAGFTTESGLLAELTRTGELLPQAVFHRYHSEHEMLRYVRRLADKDLALDRTMIPLGSCTMKLNATAEMIPITWPQFADVHPYSPAENITGYLAMIHELESMLAAITGYDAVSVQPNAGSQGSSPG